MSRYTLVRTKYPMMKPYLCYKTIRERIRNKTSERQRYYLIRKYILQFLAASKIKITVVGKEKIANLSSLFIAADAESIYEQMIVFAALDKPLKLILAKESYNGFLNKSVLAYLKAEIIDFNDIYDEAAAYMDIRKDIEKNNKNYLVFKKNGAFGQYTFDAALKAKSTIVPIRIKNKEGLSDEINQDELKVTLEILDPIKYEDYKDLKKKEISEEVTKKLDNK